jgi:hypothetical protein
MDTATIERLTRISIENPLMPETYIPWANKPGEDETFLPAGYVSVDGLPVCRELSHAQIREIERHEAVQFMYSYAWLEALAVKFLGREVAKLQSGVAETRFMYREIIEEIRHQEMFGRAIEVVGGRPILPTGYHFFWSRICCQYLPSPWMFMIIVAGELVSDSIGRAVQKDPKVYSVFKKVAELHQIEEGRHIYFAKKYLEDYTRNAGPVTRTIYSALMAMHIYFMRTMYVKQEIFERVGIPKASSVFRQARRDYRRRFAENSVQSAVTFVKEFNGFNPVSRLFWRWFLKVEVK